MKVLSVELVKTTKREMKRKSFFVFFYYKRGWFVRDCCIARYPGAYYLIENYPSSSPESLPDWSNKQHTAPQNGEEIAQFCIIIQNFLYLFYYYFFGCTYLGALLMSANWPKSSPSCSVVTTPLPWITTLTEPLRITYHDTPSSP